MLRAALSATCRFARPSCHRWPFCRAGAQKTAQRSFRLSPRQKKDRIDNVDPICANRGKHDSVGESEMIPLFQAGGKSHGDVFMYTLLGVMAVIPAWICGYGKGLRSMFGPVTLYINQPDDSPTDLEGSSVAEGDEEGVSFPSIGECILIGARNMWQLECFLLPAILFPPLALYIAAKRLTCHSLKVCTSTRTVHIRRFSVTGQLPKPIVAPVGHVVELAPPSLEEKHMMASGYHLRKFYVHGTGHVFAFRSQEGTRDFLDNGALREFIPWMERSEVSVRYLLPKWLGGKDRSK